MPLLLNADRMRLTRSSLSPLMMTSISFMLRSFIAGHARELDLTCKHLVGHGAHSLPAGRGESIAIDHRAATPKRLAASLRNAIDSHDRLLQRRRHPRYPNRRR